MDKADLRSLLRDLIWFYDFHNWCWLSVTEYILAKESQDGREGKAVGGCSGSPR